MNKTQALGILRHLLTFGAGILVAKGKLSMTDATEISGAVLALVASVWSVMAPEKSDVAVAGAKAAVATEALKKEEEKNNGQ